MNNNKNNLIIGFSVFIVSILIILELSIQFASAKRNALQLSTVLANQVSNVLEQNQISNKTFMDDLKNEYIIRAKAVSFMIDSLDEDKINTASLKHIAELTLIDEINLFNTDGHIYQSTYPRYIGYSFDSGEQIAYFKPILKNKDMSLCQDIVPNTVEGKSMMYAMTWNEAKTRLVQIGIEPTRVLNQKNTQNYDEILNNVPLYEGFEILILNNSTKQIIAATDKSKTGKTLSELGLKKQKQSDSYVVPASKSSDFIKHFGYCEVSTNYDVYVNFNLSSIYSGSATAILFVLLYLMLGLYVLTNMLNKITKMESEKQEQFAVLLSMNEMYYSLHLVDLEKNTVVEYASHDVVSDEMQRTHGENANLMMDNIMSSTLTDEWLEEGLKFSNLQNIKKLLKGKKILQKDMVGKQTGWFRMSFITIDSAPDGTPTRVVVATRIIDEEKRKEQELYEQSNKDVLTQCFNRRAFEEAMLQYEHKVAEDNLVVASFDVNSLKEINDTLGHEAGDELLKGASECMLKCFSKYGKIFRTGGDEFVGIFYVSTSELLALEEEFNYTVINWKGKILKEISIACGYAHKQENPYASVKELFKYADSRMYEDKKLYYQNMKHDRRAQHS